MIIISGASSGFGASCARALAAKHQPLLLLARREAKLQALARELGATGTEVHYAVLDVQSRRAVEQFAETRNDLLSRATALINNAGLAKGLDPVQTGNPDHWDQMIDTNVKGLLYLTRAVLPHLIAKKGGDIVQIGSIAGRWAYPKGNVYCASKSAVKMLSECMRLDLAGTGIRVIEIAPGMADTEFSLVRLDDPVKAKAVYQGMTPLSGEDVAEAVLWCLSRPRHVNIQELVIYPTDQASPWLTTRRP